MRNGGGGGEDQRSDSPDSRFNQTLRSVQGFAPSIPVASPLVCLSICNFTFVFHAMMPNQIRSNLCFFGRLRVALLCCSNFLMRLWFVGCSGSDCLVFCAWGEPYSKSHWICIRWISNVAESLWNVELCLSLLHLPAIR